MELSERKKALVGKCERCGSRKRLQSHHHHYPSDWYETTLDDLEVLCRKCHAKEHGIKLTPTYPFMIHRDDVLFSAFIYRCHCLIEKVMRGRGLRPRDEAFLDMAEATYPPRKKDTCMKFHVEQVRKWHVGFKEGRYQ